MSARHGHPISSCCLLKHLQSGQQSQPQHRALRAPCRAASRNTWHKFSKVSAPVCLLYKVTNQSPFENLCTASTGARQTISCCCFCSSSYLVFFPPPLLPLPAPLRYLHRRRSRQHHRCSWQECASSPIAAATATTCLETYGTRAYQCQARPSTQVKETC